MLSSCGENIHSSNKKLCQQIIFRHSWALKDLSVPSGTGLTMMPECLCRTKHCKLTKTDDAGLNSLSAFRHPCMSIVQIHAVSPKPCCVYMSISIPHILVHVAGPCQCCMSMSMSMYIYIEMPERRTIRHPVSPVPD